eukprot:TRINITY_DN19599_c0_g1_i1.p1 TRINITY_DN19599_c0_g1~~TRINITY_DN19599_c0_g1_i1.p1  ORF type:complete len:452 (-),score=30.88 TRINITY_DN19599_c0_g1_i1:212-1567(-)
MSFNGTPMHLLALRCGFRCWEEEELQLHRGEFDMDIFLRRHRLKRLYITVKFKALPPAIGSCSVLDILHLRLNDLEEIPPDIGFLTTLRVLEVASNKLSSLPPEIVGCSSLEELLLPSNVLTSLPSEIGRLRNLRMLNVAENRLTVLPPEIGELSALHTLDVYGNRLTLLPIQLDRLRNLTYLDAAMNRITGKFELWMLFNRLCADRHSTIDLAGNDFASIDFGGREFTTGTIRQKEPDSICIVSFCGKEFLEWQKLLIRSSTYKDWSQLCVFLEEYASAEVREFCDPSWHVGGCKDSSECKDLGRYFKRAAKYTNNFTITAHDRFGCCWFRAWIDNVERAFALGHRRFVVIKKVDATLGACQTVEWLFLMDFKKQHPEIEVRTVVVDRLDDCLAQGAAAWNGGAFSKKVIQRHGLMEMFENEAPKGLPRMPGSDPNNVESFNFLASTYVR